MIWWWKWRTVDRNSSVHIYSSYLVFGLLWMVLTRTSVACISVIIVKTAVTNTTKTDNQTVDVFFFMMLLSSDGRDEQIVHVVVTDTSTHNSCSDPDLDPEVYCHCARHCSSTSNLTLQNQIRSIRFCIAANSRHGVTSLSTGTLKATDHNIKMKILSLSSCPYSIT